MKRKVTVGILPTQIAHGPLYELLQNEVRERHEYNRTYGTILIAWLTLHWTVNLAALGACLTDSARLRPFFTMISLTFVLLNLLAAVLDVFILRFAQASAKRIIELCEALNQMVAVQIGIDHEDLTIRTVSAFPRELAVRSLWTTLMAMVILVGLWVGVLCRVIG